MESLIRDQIVVHLVRNNLLVDEQHVFVPGRNCTTQLLLCIERWSKLVEDGHNIDIIYTDFSKAFDSVPHERLFSKLKSLGIDGDLLRWIKSFLTNRMQCVNVEGFKSIWTAILSGIPQGSVLGPILFVIFINDLPLEIKHNLCKLFADDCKLYGKVQNCLENTMQVDLTNLENWSLKWQLPFNSSKCKVMYIGKKNPMTPYKLYNKVLDSTESEKDLGVMMDNSMKFHTHIVRC